MLGSMMRLIIFIVVVLPQPEGPTSTVSSPAANVRSSSRTAVVPSGYTLLTPSRRIGSAWPEAPGRAAPAVVGSAGLALPSTRWPSW